MTVEIDNVISSMNKETLVTETPAKVETPKEKSEEPKEAESKDEAKADDESEDVPFPKKAVNAISRRDKQLVKMRADMAALQAEVSKYRQPQAQPQQSPQSDNSAPKEEDFDDYGSYLEAKLLHKIKMEQSVQQKSQQDQQVQSQKQQWVQQREQEIAQKVETHKAEIPDFMQVIETNADIMDNLPEHVELAFLEADDAGLAYYNLAKEGKLEALLTMSPYRAAMEIALAQQKKPSLNRVSGAPSPIKPIAGRGSSTKAEGDLSGEELLKKYGFKY